MKASELIVRLQALVAEHGDLEVGREDNSYGCEVVVNVGVCNVDRTIGSGMEDALGLGNLFIIVG